ncbi:squalene--hopene cyclase [Paenibacillus sp. FSL R5-0527]|uniref:squalene--hopene cyclase n=1 Tax=Paenibacillus sp. FSL R5-0527 TaxID=2975321 RepID=UPI00097A1A23|nr:squalene--hopene cyclase [Paenibacillus macerans]
MGHVISGVGREIGRLTDELVRRQQPDGTWRYCFENGTAMDVSVIVLLRSLSAGSEELIRSLHDRVLAAQQPEGCWRWFEDEREGNLSATVEAYYALLFSGYSRPEDEPIRRARNYIQAAGGIGMAGGLLTKALLAATGQRKWPAALSSIPLEILLLPPSFPVSFFDFSGYSRVHLVPLLIMADRDFSLKTPHTPDLSDLYGGGRGLDEEELSRENRDLLAHIQAGIGRLIGSPQRIRQAAVKKAEQYMLERIEADGSLYTYASCTVLMVFALLALGYDRRDPLITHAVDGLAAMRCSAGGTGGEITIQNSPSTVWDTALIAYALQEAGLSEDHAAIRKAAAYLRSRQHRKAGDWQIHNPGVAPGGWGFSDTNTIIPDVDDSTAALRAIHSLAGREPACLEAWNRGLNWVLSMQNDDGGWPAFEKNTNKEMLTWLAIDGAKAAAIDPSEADLTGRTLEFLGNFARLDARHEFIRHGADWLIRHQEADGSWYGRWGICYIYGTWAALTGLKAAGLASDHEAVAQGVSWLLSVRNPDGGWGESCRSDREERYVPLRASTPSQTAWALDALIAAHDRPTAEIDQGIARLIAMLHEDGWTASYPTGAALPGYFYVHYHSYRYIWPLLALGHYRKKYGGD